MQRFGPAPRDLLPIPPQLLAILDELFVARPPGRAAPGKRVHEVRERAGHRPGIADDAERDRIVAPDRQRIDVHLHDLRARRHDLVRETGGVEAEARSNRKNEVRLAHEARRHRVPARAHAPGVQRMVHRNDVGVAGGIGDRNLELLGELQQSRRAAPPLDAGAGVNDGRLRFEDHRLHPLERRALDRAGRDFRLPPARRDRDVHLVIEQVARDLDHHRAAPPGVRHAERLQQELGHALGTRHRHHPLRHRQEHRVLVDLLKGVFPQVGGGRQPGNHHDRGIRQLRRGQPQHHVGDARPRLPADEQPGRLRHAPVGVRHVHAAVLVPRADVEHVLRVVERVVDLERARAHQPEDPAHPRRAQRLHRGDAAFHLCHDSPNATNPKLAAKPAPDSIRGRQEHQEVQKSKDLTSW